MRNCTPRGLIERLLHELKVETHFYGPSPLQKELFSDVENYLTLPDVNCPNIVRAEDGNQYCRLAELQALEGTTFSREEVESISAPWSLLNPSQSHQ